MGVGANCGRLPISARNLPRGRRLVDAVVLAPSFDEKPSNHEHPWLSPPRGRIPTIKGEKVCYTYCPRIHRSPFPVVFLTALFWKKPRVVSHCFKTARPESCRFVYSLGVCSICPVQSTLVGRRVQALESPHIAATRDTREAPRAAGKCSRREI